MSKIIRNGRVVSQTGYYKDLEDKPTINGHILEEINNTSKSLDIFVTIPKAEYEDPAFEPNVQALYAVIDEEENVRVHFFNQNEEEPEEYILHDYREIDKIPTVGDETVLYYLNKTYKDEDNENKLYRSGLWGYICLNREAEEEEREYEWRNFTETKVDDYTIHNYESIATQIGGYLIDSFETEEVVLLKDVVPTSVESDGEKTTLHCGWTSEYLPYTVNTNYKVSIRYADDAMPIFLEGEKTQRTTLPDILVPGVGNIHLQYPEVTIILDAATCPSTEIDSYKVNIIWDRPKKEFISRINPLFIPHDDTIRINEKGELSVGGLNNAYAAINKVDDYLYDTYYSGLDYNYAEKHFKELNTTAGFCSLMRSGSFIGRNYDNEYSELCDFIVHTPNRVGRYATLGVASGLSDLTKQKVESGENSDAYKILPFMLVDGINEKGVFAAYNVVPTDKALTTLTVPDIMEKKVMCALELVRFVVDNFETATAAVEYIRDYVGVYMIDQIQEEGYELHLMVADQENTYLIEFVDNKNVVQNMAANPYMTNFYQSDVIINPDRSVYTPADVAAGFLPSVENNITAHGSGLERYNTMASAFNPLVPYTSVTEMRVLLEDLKYSNTYTGLSGANPWGSEYVGINGITVDTPLATIQGDAEVLDIIDKFNNRSRDPEDLNYGTWHTLHSSVYDITNLMLNITSQEDSIEYIYNLPKLNEEDNEIKLGEISDTIIDTSENATLQLILDGIFNENKTFIINYNDEEKLLTSNIPHTDDHGVYLPIAGSPHGNYTLLRVYYDVPTKLVMGAKRYDMLPVKFSLEDIAEGSPLATNCIIAVCDDFRKITFSSPSPYKISLKNGWQGDGDVQYSYNKKDWFIWDGVTPLEPQQNFYDVYEIHFRGIDNTYIWKDEDNYSAFVVDSDTHDVKVKGNIVYMLDYQTDVPANLDHIFQGLFSGGGLEGRPSGLHDAVDLTLPFTSLGAYSYKNMFKDCPYLQEAPQIPAIETKIESCYGMFSGCTNLKECPSLPATILGDRCYQEMFKGCELITKTPLLMAQVLKEGCYKEMFKGCSSLEECTELPAVIYAIPNEAYYGMFEDCTSLTSMMKLEATGVGDSAYRNMFKGCTALTTLTTRLPAMSLGNYCYAGMFQNCTALEGKENMIKLPAKTLQKYSYQEMFSGCTSLVLEKEYELPIENTAEGCCDKMFKGCTSIRRPLSLAPMKLAKYCYREMFMNCNSIKWYSAGKAYKIPKEGKASSSEISAGWGTDMFRGTDITRCIEAEDAPIPIYVNTVYYCAPEEYLTFSSDNIFTMVNTLPSESKMGNFLYTIDDPEEENWEIFEGGMAITTIDNKFYICGRMTDTTTDQSIRCATTNPDLKVEGKLKSMASRPEEEWEAAIHPEDICFRGLFKGCPMLNDASGLELIPEFTTKYMYTSLFEGCENLKKIPEIPSVTYVNDYAYYKAFKSTGITNISNITLPGVTVNNYGYAEMFAECPNLEKPMDSLPADLDENSTYAYYKMFYNNPELKYTPVIESEHTAAHCFDSMFDGCGQVTQTFDTLLPEVVEEYAYYKMFHGTKITEAPEMKAEVVRDYGCAEMFEGCPITEYEYPIAIELGKYAYYRTFYECKELEKLPLFPEDTVMGENSCEEMLAYCTKFKELPQLKSPYLAKNCYVGMFKGCEQIKWAPFGGMRFRVPYELDPNDPTLTDATTDMVLETGSFGLECGLPGWERDPSVPGSPALSTYYWYGDPDEWVTFTSETEEFTATLNAQQVWYNEDAEEWVYGGGEVTSKDCKLKVAGYCLQKEWIDPDEDDDIINDDEHTEKENAILMSGPDVWAHGKVAALIGHDRRRGGFLFSGNTVLYNTEDLDLFTLLNYDDESEIIKDKGLVARYMFNECTNLEKINNKFPFSRLERQCGEHMFSKCSKLKIVPFKFPGATEVAKDEFKLQESCFEGMFTECENLEIIGESTKTPVLLWETLAKRCYAYMFHKCVKLTDINEVKGVEAAEGCYRGMFKEWTQLVSLPEDFIKITTLPKECMREMFEGCEKFVTTLKLDSIPNTETVGEGAFRSCFKKTKMVVPQFLPWGTIDKSSYRSMFEGCSDLMSVATMSADNKYLPAKTLHEYCYSNMYKDCENITEVYEYYWGNTDSAIVVDKYCFEGMFENTKITNTPKLLLNDTVMTTDKNEGVFKNTFKEVKTLTAHRLHDPSFKIVGKECFYQTFYQCENLTTYIPLLTNVTTIKEAGCYGLYRECVKLAKLHDCREMANVRTIEKNGCAYMFYKCEKWKRPYYWPSDMNAYTITVGENGCERMYAESGIKITKTGGCLYFNSNGLSGSALTNMFEGCLADIGDSATPITTPSVNTYYFFAHCPIYLTYTHNGATIVGTTGTYYSVDKGETWKYCTADTTISGNEVYLYRSDGKKIVTITGTASTSKLTGYLAAATLYMVYGKTTSGKSFDNTFQGSTGLRDISGITWIGNQQNRQLNWQNGGNISDVNLTYYCLFKECTLLGTLGALDKFTRSSSSNSTGIFREMFSGAGTSITSEITINFKVGFSKDYYHDYMCYDMFCKCSKYNINMTNVDSNVFYVGSGKKYMFYRAFMSTVTTFAVRLDIGTTSTYVGDYACYYMYYGTKITTPSIIDNELNGQCGPYSFCFTFANCKSLSGSYIAYLPRRCYNPTSGHQFEGMYADNVNGYPIINKGQILNAGLYSYQNTFAYAKWDNYGTSRPSQNLWSLVRTIGTFTAATPSSDSYSAFCKMFYGHNTGLGKSMRVLGNAFFNGYGADVDEMFAGAYSPSRYTDRSGYPGPWASTSGTPRMRTTFRCPHYAE